MTQHVNCRCTLPPEQATEREPLVSDIRYGVVDLRRGGAKTPVVGYQVGVLAVRRANAGTMLVLGDEAGTIQACPWLVEHWPTGGCMTDARSFEDALRIADDLSVALGDLDTADCAELEAALEQRRDVIDWLDFMAGEDRVIGLREFRAAQKGSVAA